MASQVTDVSFVHQDGTSDSDDSDTPDTDRLQSGKTMIELNDRVNKLTQTLIRQIVAKMIQESQHSGAEIEKLKTDLRELTQAHETKKNIVVQTITDLFLEMKIDDTSTEWKDGSVDTIINYAAGKIKARFEGMSAEIKGLETLKDATAEGKQKLELLKQQLEEENQRLKNQIERGSKDIVRLSEDIRVLNYKLKAQLSDQLKFLNSFVNNYGDDLLKTELKGIAKSVRGLRLETTRVSSTEESTEHG